MKVAIIHYWWLLNRGGEAVVKALTELYPNADLYLHVCDEKLVRKTLGSNFRGQIHTSFVSRLPWAKRLYQQYLPFMPLALEQLNLSAYDLVISSESGPAKGVITRPDTLHVCYCHTPMRYIWDLYHDYMSRKGRGVRFLFPFFAHWLRVWDLASAARVDVFIANSNFIASRIRKFYGRDSEVVFPPVNTSDFRCDIKRDDFYLYLGQLVPYKRVDLAVEACRQLGCRLVVIGEGEMLKELRDAGGPTVSFLGRQPFEVVKSHMESCKALLFPGLEDFGIVPVEAMAAGAPVIAYGKGGVLDTVVDNVTGVYFHEQTVESLIAAIRQLEQGQVKASATEIRIHALSFDVSIFKQKIVEVINKHTVSNEV